MRTRYGLWSCLFPLLGFVVFLVLHALIFVGVFGTRYDAWFHVNDLDITIYGLFALGISVALGTIAAVLGLLLSPKKTWPLVGLLLNVLPVLAIFFVVETLSGAFISKL